jgi:hypothetical protein
MVATLMDPVRALLIELNREIAAFEQTFDELYAELQTTNGVSEKRLSDLDTGRERLRQLAERADQTWRQESAGSINRVTA